MSVQISAMRNSHCGLKRRGFRLVTAVTLSLSINQGMDWTGQSSLPEDARDTLNAECFGAISKRFSTLRTKLRNLGERIKGFFTFRGKKSTGFDNVPVAAQDENRTRRNWVKKRQVKPAMSSTPNPADGAGTFNKTAILKELDKIVQASSAKEGDEKEIELTKLRSFVVDKKDFFEFEMNDGGRDNMIGRLLSEAGYLQEVATIMTSLPSLDWRQRIIHDCLKLLENQVEDATLLDADLKAVIEIFKCNLDLGDATVRDPVDDVCIRLTSWANTKEQEQKDLVNEIVNLAVTKSLPIYQFKKYSGGKRRIRVPVEERLEAIRNKAAARMTPQTLRLL